MSEPGKTKTDAFLVLTLRYLDGNLNEAELAALVSCLKEDEPLRDRFVEICYQDQLSAEVGLAGTIDEEHEPEDAAHLEASATVMRDIIMQQREARLREAASEAALDDQRKAEAASRVSSFRHVETAQSAPRIIVIPQWAFVGGIAAVLLLGVCMAYIVFSGGSTAVVAPPTAGVDELAPVAPPRVVAELLRSSDARWGPIGGRQGNGQQNGESSMKVVEGQHLHLQSGLAEFEMGNGARVWLQGPATVRFETNRSLRLDQGRLTASVKNRGRGFEVVTAQAKIIDLGTEFGVAVDSAGQTRAEVFTGLITLAVDGKPEGTAPLHLTQGRGAAVDSAGRVDEIEADATAYVRAEEFDALVKADAGSAYHRWLAATYRWRRDPSVVAYYVFDQEDERAGGLINQASGPRRAEDGRLGDGRNISRPIWADGRFEQTRSLRFGLDARGLCRGVLVPDSDALDLAGPMTLAFWVRRDEVGAVWNTLVSKRDLPPARLNYQFSIESNWDLGNCKFQFGAGPDIGDGAGFQTTPLVTDNAMSRWTHIAVTSDGTALRIFLNGQLVHQANQSEFPLPNDAPLLIGTSSSLLPDSHQGGPRPLVGQISEVLIADRAMAEAEVWELYDTGRPEETR